MVDRQFLHEQLYRGEDNIQKLSKKLVAIAGCGAIGSWAAVTLARMGVRRFRLIDRDRIETWNISTQDFLPQNIGQSKVKALQQKLFRISKARSDIYFAELTGGNAAALLKEADLVVCSFDNRRSKLIVKSTCLTNGIPCVFAAMNGVAFYYEVIWAENYIPPPDPEFLDIDPCNYPLSTTLALLTSATIAEIAVLFLLAGVKRVSRTSLGAILE